MSGEYPLTTDLYETPPVSPRFEPQEALQKTPHVQSKDLEALISSQSLYNILPMNVETDSFA